MFNFKAVSLFLTDYCPFVCAHCMVEASPKGKRYFDVLQLPSIISSMHKHTISTLGITGGEPCACPEILMEITSACARSNISSCIATNGFWGADKDKAITLSKSLAANGVRQMIFSFDAYHEEFISIETLQIAVIAAQAEGIAYEVRITASTWAEAMVFKRRLNDVGMEQVTSSVLETVGRARTLMVDTHTRDMSVERCLKICNPLILPAGDVVACCDLLSNPSHAPDHKSPLYLGSICLETLDDILTTARNNNILQALYRYGPDRLSYLWNSKSITQRKQGCELCYEMFGVG